MTLYTWGLNTMLRNQLEKFAAQEGFTTDVISGGDELPDVLHADDRIAVPLGEVVKVIRVLREKTYPRNFEVLAITPPGLASPVYAEKKDNIRLTCITEDELAGLALE